MRAGRRGKSSSAIIKFVDLTRLPARDASERPSLSDVELLKAEMKFESAMKKADETLLTHFDAELGRLKRTTRSQDREMRFVVEHEKDAFKEKGLVPWSRPMRKWLLQYGRELHEAQRTIGTSFDAAIERAEKNHNEQRKAALLAEAGQVLAPREVAAWQRVDKKGKVLRRTFYSDGTFADGESTGETAAQFWSPPRMTFWSSSSPTKKGGEHRPAGILSRAGRQNSDKSEQKGKHSGLEAGRRSRIRRGFLRATSERHALFKAIPPSCGMQRRSTTASRLVCRPSLFCAIVAASA